MHDEPTAIRDWQINAHLALVILCETLDARPDNAEARSRSTRRAA